VIAEDPQNREPHLLLLDIGNTRIAIATWAAGQRSDVEHVSSDLDEPIGPALRKAWDSLSAVSDRALVICSVNPPTLDRVRDACEAEDIRPVYVIGEDLDPPIDADVFEPDKVGTDRLCAAAAAFDKLQQACIVADFGTALTVDLVADNGVFLGGTILPGIGLSAQALHEHTALLPLVDVGAPTETLGKDTVSAIRNGIFAMMTGALREISEHYATNVGKWPPLVLTGGDAQAVAARCDFVDRVAPNLCLDGLVLAYRRRNESHAQP
jgi:type III pantothenate kinase